MAKSRGRKFAELVAPTNGVFAAASIPTIALSKLASSTFSVNSESASLGGNVELDSNDITEHSSALYFTNTRADSRADVRIAAHNLLARAGGTMTGNLTLGDNVNAYFGASTDLRIYHDGTNSHIINSTGELRVTGSNIAIKSDSAKLYFGLSDDLQIYHDGSHSFISDQGTGHLKLLAGDFRLNNSADNAQMISAVSGGSVYLYDNNSVKLQTTSTGVTVTGLASMTTGVATSKFAVASTSVHGSYDFYNNGTGYNNGAFTVDDTLFANNVSILDTGILRVGTNQTWSVAVNPSSSIRLAYDGVERSITGHYTDGMSIRTNAHILRLATDGKVHFPAFTFPASDGTNGQVLQTNGSGVLSWSTAAGGGSVWSSSGSDIYYTSGNIGIGSSSPSTKLDIKTANIGSSSNFATKAISVRLPFVSGYNNVIASGIGFYDNTIHSADIGLAYNRNSTGGYDLAFSTNPTTSGSPVERMTINADGLVGIGTNNPSAPLHVVGSDSGIKISSATSDRPHLSLVNGTAEILRLSANANYGAIGDSTSGERYMVFRAGKVGIGTDNPSKTLEVTGEARIDKESTFSNATTPGTTATYGLHFGGQSTNNSATGITFSAGSATATNANAGIYVQGSGSYGTKMYLATTDAYATGSKTALQIDHTGLATFIRQTPKVNANVIWHAGNDGAGSGLDADTVDGIQAASFLRSDATDTVSTYSNKIQFYSNTNMATGSGSQASLEAYSNGSGNDAFMTFHVGGDFACYFGLDGGTNKLSVGGWSMGANSYEIYHAGNKPSLATLGFTGASNANYITNNNQLTNGAGYLTSSNDRIFITDTRGANRLPSYYDDRYIQADFTQSTYLGASGGDVWAAVLTVSPWTVYHSSHRQQQLIFAGTNLYRRTASSDNGWGTTYKLWDSGNLTPMISTGMANNADTYMNFRVMRNSNSSSLNDGMYIGYQNSNSGVTRIFGGGATTGGLRVNGAGNNDVTINGGTVWHSLNDGSGSGLDADTLDTLSSTDFARIGSSYASYFGGTANSANLLRVRCNGNIGSTSGYQSRLEVYSDNGVGTDAFMSFHVSSDYAVYFGLDGGLNDLAVGGWSMGGVNRRIFHEGNLSPVKTNVNSTIENNIYLYQRGQFTTGTSGQNNSAQAGTLSYHYGYQFGGAWSNPFPDLVFGFHTGIRFGGHVNYGGCRFYDDHPSRTTTIIFSVGNGDSHVRATNNIYAYTSDKRLKENFRPIENAVDKVKAIGGFIFDWRKDMMDKHEFIPDQEKDDAGLIAQEVQKVMPAAIRRAPFDHDLTKPNQSKSGEEFLTVQYEKMVPLLVEAIKEQQKQIDELKKLLEKKE